MRKVVAAVAGWLLAGFAALTLASPAQAGGQPVEPWKPLDTAVGGAQAPSAHSQIVDSTTADATWKAGEPASALGTSIESANLGVPVESGDEVAVGYELRNGASPAAGSVRLFIYDHPDGDTFGEAPKQFVAVPNDGPTTGTLTITANFTGTIGTAGVVYDTSNGGVPGTVRFSNLMVGDAQVSFLSPKSCEAYETPGGGDLCGYPEKDGDLDCADLAATDRPVKVLDSKNDPYDLDRDNDGIGCEVEPTPTPSQSESTVPPTTTPADQAPVGDNLPITGPPTGKLITAGVVLLLGGGVVLFYGRTVKRRFEA